MNINAKHFQGWVYTPSTEHRFPMVELPPHPALSGPSRLCINEPTGSSMPVYDEIARLIANAPDLFRLAERFFSFYELHKAARGGALGREYEELRAKIMGEVKP